MIQNIYHLAIGTDFLKGVKLLKPKDSVLNSSFAAFQSFQRFIFFLVIFFRALIVQVEMKFRLCFVFLWVVDEFYVEQLQEK